MLALFQWSPVQRADQAAVASRDKPHRGRRWSVYNFDPSLAIIEKIAESNHPAEGIDTEIAVGQTGIGDVVVDEFGVQAPFGTDEVAQGLQK